MTEMSNATIFSTIMSEGVRNTPRDLATKELIKNNFNAIQKFKSIEIRAYESETDSLIEMEDVVFKIDFEDYLMRLKIVAEKINEFWKSAK